MTGMTELDRKLKRAAVEPSRVFAESDIISGRYPLLHLRLDGESWYGAHSPAWLFVGADDRTLGRALAKWGEWSPQDPSLCWRMLKTLENLLRAGPVGEAPFEGAELVTLSSGTIVPAFCDGVIPGHMVLATPVYYARRRYGAGRWVVLDCAPVVRYEVDGRAVALVRGMRTEQGGGTKTEDIAC